MSGIAVFDIDGTLTDTNDVDVECYEAAVLSEIGVEIPSEWPSFDDVTDAAILAEACRRQGIEIPRPSVQERIADKIGELLTAALEGAPDRFRPVPGALEIFGHLQRRGWSVAMATGAWRPSALVKLRGAGIPHDGVPLASASDHWARAEIIRRAVAAISPRPARVVYVGDGIWDGRAARALGYSFLGVGSAERAPDLREAGAGAVVRDFTDPDAVLGHLSRLAKASRSP